MRVSNETRILWAKSDPIFVSDGWQFVDKGTNCRMLTLIKRSALGSFLERPGDDRGKRERVYSFE